MGAVYLMRHKILNRKMAIKFLHHQFSQKESVLKRFYREANAAAQIGHKNIIEVYDMGVSSVGEPYIVMEYLEGENLAQLLKRVGPMSLPAACAVLEPALKALSAAHQKGIVHRDLKPVNMFLISRDNLPPVLKLIDFGISKFTDSTQTKLTKEGTMLGTPSYMSPEQVKGSLKIDHRTDLYSMGVIMYEMLTGKVPFPGAQLHEILVAVLRQPPPSPKEIYSGFPQAAEPMIMKSLEKEPSSRYANATEMLADLTQLPGYGGRQAALRNYISDIATKTVLDSSLAQPVSLQSTESVISKTIMNDSVPPSGASTPSTNALSSNTMKMPAVTMPPSATASTSTPAPAANMQTFHTIKLPEVSTPASIATPTPALEPTPAPESTSAPEPSSMQLSNDKNDSPNNDNANIANSQSATPQAESSQQPTSKSSIHKLTGLIGQNKKISIGFAIALVTIFVAGMGIGWATNSNPPIAPINAKDSAVTVAAPPPKACPKPPETAPPPKKTTPVSNETAGENQKKISIKLKVTPRSAKITIDGIHVSNPYKGIYTPSPKSHDIQITAPGYKPLQGPLVFDAPIQNVYKLTQNPGKKKKKKRSK